jgi:alanyl-tRNA synthetase
MTTNKLYWHDARQTSFTARVADVLRQGDQRFLVLDRTAFYPEGGGQPADRGTIGLAAVEDVSSGDDGQILHRVTGDADFAVGDEVTGLIDAARRLEMTQQHTGQHILSQAFFQLFGAETKGFRITGSAAEIDLTLELQPDEIRHAITQAEDLANSVVFDNREIRTHLVTPEEAAKMPLRKESFISDCVRVIEIADFDWSPCGGTHAARTGEVGLIAVRGWERAKQMTRVHFICGVRALQDYRAANQAAENVARSLSVGRDEITEAVSRLQDENKQLQRRVRALAELAATAEARELVETTAADNGVRVVSRIFADRGLDEIKLLAHRLVAHSGVVALLAARERETARLVFARSADVKADLNVAMRKACEMLGGRGGGRPDFAQGGGAAENLDRALREAASLALQS